MTLFYCAHWQTYVSGTLHFGRIDVTEAQYTIIFIQMLSAICGPSIWSVKVFSFVFPIRAAGIGSCNTYALNFTSFMHIFYPYHTLIEKNTTDSDSFMFCLRNCPQFFRDTFDLWYLIPIMTLACGLWSVYQTLIVVFTGGVGKNGSTVAVSCCVWENKRK